MQTAIFKFLALSGVIALGCFVVYQVHTRIPPVGEQALSPGDFRSVANDETGTDPDSGIPAADSGMQGPPTDRLEADSVAQPSLVGEPPPWSTLPLQSESESQPASGSTTVPAAFWSEDSAAISTADDAREAPGSQSEVSASQTVQAADPAIGPEAPWLSDDLPEADSANSPEPGEGVVAARHDADEEPRTLTPLENVQPLPGAFIPDDDEDWARDEPSEAIADHDLIPVDGVQPSSQTDPFAITDAPSDPGHREPEAAELPLLDFQNEPEPEPDDGVPTDPFSGFTEQASPSVPVLPANPRDAGFSESRAIPIPPTVSSNPFAFAETEPEHGDDTEAPVLQRVPDSGPAPESPASGADAPWNDPPEESPEIASPPLPTRGLGASVAEPAQAPRLPVLLDDAGDSAAPADLTPNPITAIADDEESEPEPAMQSDPFATQSVVPDSRSRPENVLEPAGTLELVGDATIDRASASTSQQPELDIEKIAPPEASVGSPLIYAIHIRNVGRSAAHGVVVEDRIPRGTVLDGTIPQAELTDKVLTWKLGTIEPGQEETIRIKVTPTEAGEIGSVATVRFAAEVSAATSITSADLRLDMDGPREVALGETAVFHYTLTNAGDGPARGAYIRCLLPAAFEHPGGADIEYEVGDLQPGQSRDVELEIRAVEPGTHLSRVLLNANGRTHDESELSVNVLPSRLLISREGPARRFVGRSARYTTEITNRSGVDLTGISVVEQLPTALELAGIPEDGTYDPQNRTITWTIPSLAAGASVTVNSTVVAREYGLHSTSITARDRDGNEAHVMSDLQVAGFSTLEVDWEHDGKPLAVGEQVAMRLTIRNEGTAPARNVQAVFEVPPQMEFVNAQGPVPYQQEGQFVRFDSVSELAIDGEQSFDIVLTAAAPGNTRVSAQLLSADQSEPLRHDEPLFILQDEN